MNSHRDKQLNTFQLNGNQAEIRHARINDPHLDVILRTINPTISVRHLNVSFNEITDYGAKLLAAFLKVFLNKFSYNNNNNNNNANANFLFNRMMLYYLV